MRWILNGPALETFARDPVARTFLSDSRPYVVRRRDARGTLPGAWRAEIVRTYTSVADLERAAGRGAIGPEVRAVLYDNEAWPFTPEAEQRDPAGFTERAAALARACGVALIAAPAVTLTRVLAPGPERRYDAYLRLGLAAAAARHADVYVVQAQGSERDLPRYASFVDAAGRQAREANPRVRVFAGISTNPSGIRVSAGIILRAIAATRGVVDGYWFNVPKPGPYCPGCTEFRPDLAIEVFRRLASGTEGAARA
jgi:hypothetical protein